MLNPDENMAKELNAIVNDDLRATFPNARLKHEPHPAAKPSGTTVQQDIEALKARLALIAQGIELLKAQL
jgi:hypothetical protein